MAVTIKQTEEQPQAYPEPPDGLSAKAAALEADFIWQRIESHVAHRWTPRGVEWVVEGPGDWHPPLVPATITATEIWRGDEWQEVTLPPSPWGGFVLNGHGPYRFTATVGADSEAPASVLEAFLRLAEYMAQSKGKAGARSERIGAGSISLSHTRHPAWMAQAMQNSGAGDLLRNLRRAS